MCLDLLLVLGCHDTAPAHERLMQPIKRNTTGRYLKGRQEPESNTVEAYVDTLVKEAHGDGVAKEPCEAIVSTLHSSNALSVLTVRDAHEGRHFVRSDYGWYKEEEQISSYRLGPQRQRRDELSRRRGKRKMKGIQKKWYEGRNTCANYENGQVYA